MDEEMQKKIDLLAEQMNADILIYIGDIENGYDTQIIEECAKRDKKKDILLILSTYGGSPDAAYRIARCLQETYQTIEFFDGSKQVVKRGDFIVFVDGPCKSAGTLLCLGADKLILSDNGELGPIDMQLPKENEVRGWTSGLTPIQAMEFLDKKTIETYREVFGSVLKFHSRISTKLAAEMAIQLTIGTMKELYAQIDPLKLAEVDRALSIAKQYGRRLMNGNLTEEGLYRLLGAYPSHGFVIDRREAKEIFTHIEMPSVGLREVGNYFRQYYTVHYNGSPEVWFASTSRMSLGEILSEKQNSLVSSELEGD